MNPIILRQEGSYAAQEAADTLGATNRTLANWERKGLLIPMRLPLGHKRHRKAEVEVLVGGVYSPRGGREWVRAREVACRA